MKLKIAPLFPAWERDADESGSRFNASPRLIDVKVRELVLPCIHRAKGGLLSAAIAPQIIIGLFPGFESVKMENKRREKRKSRIKKSPFQRKAPAGLLRLDPEGWVNALLQFIFYIPGFAENFIFAPKSLSPILDFIDQYSFDLEENLAISDADTPGVFRMFAHFFPDFTIQGIFESLVRLVRPNMELVRSFNQIEHLGVSDFLVIANYLKKQVVIELDCIYDLNAFIEKRPDHSGVSYVAYVKVEGRWYQCDDDRITQLRSNELTFALQRGILAHYKRLYPNS